jgi:MFS superfamily sulfate permease-like transporter
MGIIFFAFGFMVSFKKKYNLVSFFTKSPYTKNENYAEQIGLISLMSGMIYIFAGIVGLVSASLIFTVTLMVACIGATASLMTMSTIKARKA